jgi:hypothetical protein
MPIYPTQGPWAGQISSSMPKTALPANAFESVLNWFTVRGRLQPRPKINSYVTAADGLPVYGARSFLDVNSNSHTILLTTKNAYALTSGPTLTALTFPAGVTDLGSVARPFGIAAILNRVYFSNGVVPLLYTDGGSALRIAGDVPGSARFLATIGGHLMTAYLRENGVDYTNRLRWCDAGNPNSWKEGTSGFNILFEVPDEITGLIGSSRSAFCFRSNGITVITPTGLGTNPFVFEHLTTEPEGIGNKYPYALAAYGNRWTIMVSDDDVYGVNLPNLEPLGGSVNREIFKDINSANGPIVGRILPNLGVAYNFPAYYLTIPKAGTSTTWVLSLRESTWQKMESSAGAMTMMATVLTA